MFAPPLPPTHVLHVKKPVCRYCGAPLGSIYWKRRCWGYMS